MAKPYRPGPKQFTYAAADGSTTEITAADAQEAVTALYAFVDGSGSDSYTVHDRTTGESLGLLVAEKAVVRHREGGGTDRVEVPRADRCLTAAMLFFESGHAGLDRFGQWVAEGDEPLSPEDHGAARASAITSEAAALAELGRLWADSGYVDPSDQFYVFFDSHGLDDDRADRVVVLRLSDVLGLERVEAPAGAADGEVWVRRDPRLDAEVDRWA